ncbi:MULTISPECIES: hypothetical protein [unclassified Agrobacterium]
MDKPVIAVWFSCGAASAVAAKLTLEQYSDTHEIRILNNFILEEDEDNRRFLKDVEQWLGHTIEPVSSRKFPSGSAVEVWDAENFMAGPKGATCTRILKKGARQEWEEANKAAWHVFGFTSEEEDRHNMFVLTERDNVLPVLIEADLTKQDCFEIITAAGLMLPRSYFDGWPNANCLGCVKATSPTYWNHLRKLHPEIFRARAEQSRRIGARLVRWQGRRIFLDELPEDAIGRPLKSMVMPECGIFCEEKIRVQVRRKINYSPLRLYLSSFDLITRVS